MGEITMKSNGIFFIVTIGLVIWVESQTLTCYTCGLSAFDPVLDGFNYSSNPKVSSGKMYNESCEQFETMIHNYPSSIEKWTRPCYPNVKNCFWAQGTYDLKTARFRGCTNTSYAQDSGCTQSLQQAVTITENKTSVDVTAKLCFCNTDRCNENSNDASKHQLVGSYFLPTIVSILIFSKPH